MAYMNQERKQALAPQIKAVLEQYKMKGTLSVQHHSGLVVTITEGPLDIVGNWNDVAKAAAERRGERFSPRTGKDFEVNEYYINEGYTGKVQEFLLALKQAMNECPTLKNHNRSDSQSDYHDVGWYIDIRVGKWKKPYKLVTDKTVNPASDREIFRDCTDAAYTPV